MRHVSLAVKGEVMNKPKALDLFCGAGGATMGLMRAGFDVVGVDINRKRGERYPATFVCGDALRPPVELRDFDFIWASPPCQHFSVALAAKPEVQANHPDLVEATRFLLNESGVPHVIENVPQAPIRADIVLTGAMFDLDIVRRRHFEVSGFEAPFMLSREDWRRADYGGLAVVAGHGGFTPMAMRKQGFKFSNLPAMVKEKIQRRNNVAGWRAAMRIEWMTQKELAEAIPPAYSEYIGRAFMDHLGP